MSRRSLLTMLLNVYNYTFERVKVTNVNSSWYPHMYLWVDNPQYNGEVGGSASSKVVPLDSYITANTTKVIYTFYSSINNEVTYALYYDATTIASGTISAGGSDVAITVNNSEHTIYGHKIRAVMDYVIVPHIIVTGNNGQWPTIYLNGTNKAGWQINGETQVNISVLYAFRINSTAPGSKPSASDWNSTQYTTVDFTYSNPNADGITEFRNAFSSNTLTKVVLPNIIENCATDYMFYRCTALVDVSFVNQVNSIQNGVDFSYATSLTKSSITNILNAIDLTSASTNRNLVLSTNAQTIINADTDLTAKVTAAITAGWSITYQTR